MDGVDDDKGNYTSLQQQSDTNPGNLIDRDLVDLLKFCYKLYQQNKEGNDDYATNLYMKSFELGKKVKNKVLVFDMDETLIAARFEQCLPEGFKTTFSYDFHGEKIHVRTRPYL